MSLVEEMVDRGSGRGDLVDAYGGRARHVGTHTDEREVEGAERQGVLLGEWHRE